MLSLWAFIHVCLCVCVSLPLHCQNASWQWVFSGSLCWASLPMSWDFLVNYKQWQLKVKAGIGANRYFYWNYCNTEKRENVRGHSLYEYCNVPNRLSTVVAVWVVALFTYISWEVHIKLQHRLRHRVASYAVSMQRRESNLINSTFQLSVLLLLLVSCCFNPMQDLYLNPITCFCGYM